LFFGENSDKDKKKEEGRRQSPKKINATNLVQIFVQEYFFLQNFYRAFLARNFVDGEFYDTKISSPELVPNVVVLVDIVLLERSLSLPLTSLLPPLLLFTSFILVPPCTPYIHSFLSASLSSSSLPCARNQHHFLGRDIPKLRVMRRCTTRRVQQRKWAGRKAKKEGEKEAYNPSPCSLES
jgi:hypothetical protein